MTSQSVVNRKRLVNGKAKGNGIFLRQVSSHFARNTHSCERVRGVSLRRVSWNVRPSSLACPAPDGAFLPFVRILSVVDHSMCSLGKESLRERNDYIA